MKKQFLFISIYFCRTLSLINTWHLCRTPPTIRTTPTYLMLKSISPCKSMHIPKENKQNLRAAIGSSEKISWSDLKEIVMWYNFKRFKRFKYICTSS